MKHKILVGKILGNQSVIRQICQRFTPPTFPTLWYMDNSKIALGEQLFCNHEIGNAVD